jgi:hypothetical protein
VEIMMVAQKPWSTDYSHHLSWCRLPYPNSQLWSPNIKYAHIMNTPTLSGEWFIVHNYYIFFISFNLEGQW